MKYEIDQSGKIESQQLTSIVGIASVEKSITASIKPKQKSILFHHIQTVRPLWSHGLASVYIFSIIAALLIIKLKTKDEIIIDEEYTGHEAVIKNRILQICHTKKLNITPEQIVFHQIGKKSPAHRAVYNIHLRKAIADYKLTASDILPYLPIKK